MAESKVNRENYILVQGFMLADLKLKGNELIIYACIYGFSQAENQFYNGSLQYLADWTNSTKQSVIKCLKSLIEKGYIEKKETFINGVSVSCPKEHGKLNLQTALVNSCNCAFAKIADGSKTIELRLNDEKRKRINAQDTVVFNCSSTKDIITAQISGLHKFSDFKELYNALPLEKCGYTVAELDIAHYTDMEQYYTKEQIKKYGTFNDLTSVDHGDLAVEMLFDNKQIFNFVSDLTEEELDLIFD